jgi:hypothetical protein
MTSKGTLIMKKSLRTTLFPLIMLVIALMVVSAEAKSEKFKEISAPEVKNMIEGDQTVVVHVLSGIEYEMQHIPGSINIPITDIETSKALPQDKSTPLVFYCMGKR